MGMYVLELGLLVVGAVLLVVGYRRNRRTMLVAAALVLLVSGVVPDVVEGFAEGRANADARPWALLQH
ncbi:hypothetical protein [Stenotrophomonas nematodicola]|uniref:hypothetical protein n=1 Tax=Stenotrophomonas nematodicola TaxID=2656746 RepID=UPI003D9AA0F6